MRDVLGLESQTEPLVGLMELAEVCGWWAPYKHLAIIQHRHSELHLDERGRLHNQNDMSVRYRDGWGVYAIHGARVPEWVVTRPAEITADKIEAETNAEVRRVMIDRYGADRYLVDSGAKQVHADEFGVLFRKNIRGDEPLVMVKLKNSTPEPDGTFKHYFIRVPPTIQRAREACAWMADVSEAEYAPEIET